MPELECGAVTRVKVVFHAEFRRVAGVKETEFEILGQATVRDVLAMIAERVPALEADTLELKFWSRRYSELGEFIAETKAVLGL